MHSQTSQREFDMLKLFERFISDSKRGKRLQPNGKRIGSGTIANYGYTLELLKSFSENQPSPLRVRPVRNLGKREMVAEKNYWKKFYNRFTVYLYQDCGHYDNYVGQTIKNIRVFFNYLNKELTLGIGDFHKLFYVRKEEIPIFPLMPEELNFLIADKTFESGLSKRMLEVKDFFVFGCTVGLRCSDLFKLRSSHVRTINGSHYLAVRSTKTSTDSLIRLPDYAVAITHRYRRSKKLLPHFNKVNLNLYVKRLLEAAGFTSPVQKIREKRGEVLEIRNLQLPSKGTLRFCDVASTHTMRRTAITTMLCLGVPEPLVRKLCGYSPGSKEFYRYVLWAQVYQDRETEKLFHKLGEKRLEVA
jgi:integrase